MRINWKFIEKFIVSAAMVVTLGLYFFINVFNDSEIATNGKSINSRGFETNSPTSQPLLINGQAKTDETLLKTDRETKAQISQIYGKLPLTFEANKGQIDSRAQYLSRGDGYNLFLTGNEAVIALRSPVEVDKSAATGDKPESANKEQSVLRMKLVGANDSPEGLGLEPQLGKSNYFIGNDRRKWRTNVNHYARVQYSDVYPGVDVVYYGNQRQLEYDFVVAPGVSPDIIKMSFEGAQDLTINADGDLILRTAGGDIRQHKPIIYQETDGGKQVIAGRYEIKGDREIGFELAAYDTTKTLVIDPVINYSTYLGGKGEDAGYGIAVDSSGNAYITGHTASVNFPIVNPLPSGGGIQDVFVAKINTAGSALVYSTYLGGGGFEQGRSIAVDSLGSAYITGYTASRDYPTVNPVQSVMQESTDAFITKLDSSGSSLVYSTFLGGSDFEEGRGIAVDPSGNAYVTGQTDSVNFPTVNALQPIFGGYQFAGDAFVTKINPSGSAFIYSTFLGGYGYDEARGIAADSSGNAYITGVTYSSDFPTVNAFQSTIGSSCFPIARCFDAFVTKLNPSGSAFIYSTFLGGHSREEGNGIAVDSSGNAYVTGDTNSSNFPTFNAIQPTFSGGSAFIPQADAFVMKFNASGTPVYSTFLGGGNTERGNSIAVDSSGNAYVTGETDGYPPFPLVNPVQEARGGATDVFITKINQAGSEFLFSTFLGGSYYEDGRGIAVDSMGNAFIIGRTASVDFPTASAIQPNHGNNSDFGGDAFVAKINTGIVVIPTPPSISVVKPNRGGNAGRVSVAIHGSGFVNGATVKLVSAGLPDIFATAVSISGDGTIASTKFNLTGQAPGVRDVIVTNPNGSTANRNQGFTIENNGYSDVWVDIIGPNGVRLGVPRTFYFYYGNRGNLDSKATPLFVAFPSYVIWKPGFQIIAPPQPPELPQIDWGSTSFDSIVDGRVMLSLILPPLPPNTSGVLPIQLTIPDTVYFQESNEPHPISVWTSPPFEPEPNPVPPVPGEPGGDGDQSSNKCMDSIVDLGLEGLGLIPLIPDEISVPEDKKCYAETGEFLMTSLPDFAVDRKPEPSATSILQFGFEGALVQAQCRGKLGGQTASKLLKVYDAFKIGFKIGNVLNGCFGTDEIFRKLVYRVLSIDPNDKIGPTGVGPQRYLSGEEPLRYAIYFENKPTTSAPAQEVVVTDQLDAAKLDFDTFSFGPIVFGDNKPVVPPSGLSEFTKDVDLRPENNLIVRINAKLDKTTGLITWRFTSLDPITMQPTEDPYAGFLPPNINAPQGDGQVLFTVQPKNSLATGTEIRNKARIVFDTNAPIDTPEWLNTIDHSKPISKVLPLSALQNSNKFTVNWSGTDTGSGIQSYTVFVSENGGPFRVWKRNTTETSGVFTGKADTTYAFYSVAQDKTGNNEIAPPTADATTQTPVPDTIPPSITITAPTETNYLLGQNVTASYSCRDNDSEVASCTGTTVSGAAIDTASVGTKTFSVTATDNAGNTATQTITYQVGYKIVALFDQTKLHNSGSAIPVKLQIANVSGANRSAANIAVTALRVMPGFLSVQSPGNSQPGNLFKFENGTYQFNLKSEKSWASGTYQLFFSISDDPIEHSVQFRIK